MLRISNQTIRRLLTISAALLFRPGWLAAQASAPQPGLPIPGAPIPAGIEIASLTAVPAAPETSTSKNALSSGPAFATVPAGPLVEFTAPSVEPVRHRFWDRENRALFLVAGGLAGADFAVTHANLASGGRELNPITRIFCGSTPALAANFVLETGGVIGVGYLFHRSGHHRLERVTSYLNISASAGAVIYGLTHR
jgi:hypothetical protein